MSVQIREFVVRMKVDGNQKSPTLGAKTSPSTDLASLKEGLCNELLDATDDLLKEAKER